MRRIALILMVATVMAVVVVSAAPAVAVAQEEKKKEKKKDMPKSGGFSGSDAALLGLGAGALITGGILVRATRR